MEVLVGLGLVFLVIWHYAIRRPRAAMREVALQAMNDAAQTHAEERAFMLIMEFPDVSDHGIADLMRDELTNARVSSAIAHEWASSATVARVRRTMIVKLSRSGSGGSKKKLRAFDAD